MRWWLVVAGLVIGALGSVFVLVATALAVGNTAGDINSGYGVTRASLVSSGFWAVVGTVLLIVPRTRQAGAGLLLGMSISLILLSGVCAVIGTA